MDESAVARGIVDSPSVQVKIAWREAEKIPSVIASLAELQPFVKELLPLEFLELVDGTFEVLPKRDLNAYRRLRFGNGRKLFDAIREVPEDARNPQLVKACEYATELVRQYLPSFNPRASKEEAEFLIATINRLSGVSRSLEDLKNHLEYAAPNKRKAVPPLKDPERDVRAAILKDVHELTSPKIGRELGIRFNPKWREKRENQNVKFAIKRGRGLLERCFGTQEWQEKAEHIKDMRARAKQLRAERLEKQDSMDIKQQFYALLAEYRITSPKEEQREAVMDGFDKMLDDWIDAHERNDERWVSIQLSDPRFNNALSVL
jgi:hypothetical protein